MGILLIDISNKGNNLKSIENFFYYVNKTYKSKKMYGKSFENVTKLQYFYQDYLFDIYLWMEFEFYGLLIIDFLIKKYKI